MAYFKGGKSFFIAFAFILIFIIPNAFCQSYSYQIKYDGFFDNWEHDKNIYSKSKTFFGQQLGGNISVLLKDSSELTGGVVTRQLFGTPEPSFFVHPEIYYKTKKKHFEIVFGIFPISMVSNLYSRAQFSDTIRYFRPLASGVNIRLGNDKIFEQFWIDWIGRKEGDNREELMIGAAGVIPIFNNDFSVKNAFKIHHVAVSETNPQLHIQDNVSGEIMLKMEKHLSVMDFYLSTGAVGSGDRERTVYSTKWALGSLSEAYIRYKFAALKLHYYAGEGQRIISGDNLYKAKSYGRADIEFLPFENPDKLKLRFTVHLVESLINYSQLISVSVNLNEPVFKVRRKISSYE